MLCSRSMEVSNLRPCLVQPFPVQKDSFKEFFFYSIKIDKMALVFHTSHNRLG